MHTETETKMMEIWKEILENDNIGYEDNFFEVGGNSLNAMSLLDRMQEEFNIEISVADLFDCRNICEFSAVVDNYLKEV
ncbi:MAG: hypothetical protein K5979_09805 [Ruminococcus sp.]|nr:hypothetical protein [Ruminococcus sp.]